MNVLMSDRFLNKYQSPKLDQRSLLLRRLIIKAFEGGGRGHLGSSMSLVEIMRVLFDKILTPFVTEKTTNLSEQNKIVFKVPRNANKKNLKNNIEKIFKVNVTKINIVNKKNRIKLTRGRKVKVSGFKKAIITLKKGQSIDLTTGI